MAREFLEDDERLVSSGQSRVESDREFLLVDGVVYTILGPLDNGQRAVLPPSEAYGLGTLRRSRGKVEVRRRGRLLFTYRGHGFTTGIRRLVREEGR
jgi:hypothetical protein